MLEGIHQAEQYIHRPWDRRNCSLEDNSCRKVLLSGASYSGTGFLSKIFTSNNCPIGHECLDSFGVSDWRRSFMPIDESLFFTHVFVQVRHPLSVVKSWTGTNWNFRISSIYNCSDRNHLTGHPSLQETVNFEKNDIHIPNFVTDSVLEVWSKLPGEIKMLEYWTIANIRSLPLANMWWKLENMNSQLALRICTIIGCPLCDSSLFASAIEENLGHNKHRENDNPLSWPDICRSLEIGNEHNPDSTLEVQTTATDICTRARYLCRHLGYDDCWPANLPSY